jgi:hypothetical protein
LRTGVAATSWYLRSMRAEGAVPDPARGRQRGRR